MKVVLSFQMFKKLNSKRLNLWIINQFANTPDMPGSSRHYELSEYFVSQNLEVNVFSSDFNLATRSFLRLNKMNEKNVFRDQFQPFFEVESHLHQSAHLSSE